MRSCASRSSSRVVKAPQNPDLPPAGGFGDGNVGRTRQPHSRTLAAHPGTQSYRSRPTRGVVALANFVLKNRCVSDTARERKIQRKRHQRAQDLSRQVAFLDRTEWGPKDRCWLEQPEA